MTGRRRTAYPRPFQFVIGTAVAGALLLSGCGVLPGGPGGSGEPVTVMTWAPDQVDDADAVTMPGVPAMAKTYARWINEQGGIDGRELRVITCDERDTAAGAERCARQAVDREVAAVVGSYSRHGQSAIPVLESGGIPYIGGYGASDEEFRSYLSYPVNGGQSALLAGHGRQLAGGCERVSLVRPDSLGGARMPQLLNTGLLAAQRPESTDILAPENATSYDEQAGRALKRRAGGDCVAAVLGARTETFFDSFRRLEPEGERVRISSVLGSVSQPLIDRTGGRTSPFEGAYVTGWYPDAGDARWNGMREVIREHAFGDNSIDPDDTGVQTTWIAYTVLKAVVEAIDDDTVTANKVTSTLNRGTEVDTGGLTPVLRWRFKDLLGTSPYPRIVNADVTFQVVREGRLTAQKKGFVDVTEALSDARRAVG
ncbi:ABC transporter substrate-binding protein [Streptomyces cyaneofuscatus]|uniref:ABC transporter substrate-binding protein n=1 Tax=Streptomyces TaxID=1883 RepID=UPI000376CA37|nr:MULTISPECIES: ABC transporter substrate-binding protein [Streptomyces]MZF53544.1 ABC transporter substrate-binding protein [Streptomyces sp. SID5594]WRO11964.1 ABC transporter substrate-binding protein [Streptomyces cyaneofuscatus]